MSFDDFVRDKEVNFNGTVKVLEDLLAKKLSLTEQVELRRYYEESFLLGKHQADMDSVDSMLLAWHNFLLNRFGVDSYYAFHNPEEFRSRFCSNLEDSGNLL